MMKPVLQKHKALLAGFLFVGSVFFAPIAAFAVEATSIAQSSAAQTSVITCNLPTAVLAAGSGVFLNSNGCNAVSNALKTTDEKVVKPELRILLAQSLLQLLNFVTNRLAYEAAVYIANGGPGEGSMFYKKTPTDAWAGLGTEIAGEAVGNLNDALKSVTTFNLCVPPSPLIRLNLQIGIKQTYIKVPPKCDFDQFANNWESVWADAKNTLSDSDQLNRFLLQKAQQAMRPNSNELGASIALNFQVGEAVDQKKKTQYDEILSGGLKNVKDLVTGDIKTPKSIVEDDFKKRLAAVDGDQSKISVHDILTSPDVGMSMLFAAGQTFTNTLGSQLFNRVYKGMFQTTPDKFDPFNTELVSTGNDLEASKKQLGEIFTPSTINVTHYDILANFASCPPENIANRAIDTCVIDTNFLTILQRGASENSLTVQEAMDQKPPLIDGNWPLISDEDTQKNGDLHCRNYGFCYGNLVKLRKARVIPIGWELAAHKNAIDNPKTLKQVMDAFNNCNAQGLLDASHPWCHLIDPNWVLKAPESECRATVNGEIRNGLNLPGRQSYCADAPTCIGEDNNGNCVNGFGYCVEEKNIWRIKGDECPAYYATCLSLKNTADGSQNNFLLNTVDNSVCSKSNAGCAWYKTQKSADAKGVFQWYTGAASYDVAAQGSSFLYAGSKPSPTNTTPYSFQDRLYLTHAAKECTQEQAGCTELNVQDGTLALNLIQNGSFETQTDGKMPDVWSVSASSTLVKDPGSFGSGSVSLLPGADIKSITQTMSVTPGNFYTFSYYARKTDASKNSPNVAVQPLTQAGDPVELKGLSYSQTTCTYEANNQFYRVNLGSLAPADGWKRFMCTFSLPATAAQVRVQFGGSGGNDLLYDAFQLESGENPTKFVENGYNNTRLIKAFLKLAPAYLGCKGLPSDSAECKKYAPVCQAQDVGCNLYTPTQSSSPNVPAIASSLDVCPSECVGYDTFKQEATPYEMAVFPTYFIADKASVCSAQAVGCDGFTKLGTVQGGGEQQRYFTNLRACLTKDMATGDVGKTAATYFTWLGSDNAGYQLQTWSLLQSNLNAQVATFTNSKFTENSWGLAPCTKVQIKDDNTLTCADDQMDGSAFHFQSIKDNASCDEHSDVIANPDCREFFDSVGNIHYRLFSQTVSVDNACEAFRKDKSTQPDCVASGGLWNAQGFCRYFGLETESKVCSAAENGCREYTGGAGNVVNTIFSDKFESGTVTNWENWKGSANKSTIVPSNDSVAAGGYSLRLTASKIGSSGMQTVPSTSLKDKLVKGKIYTLQFWAKGTGSLRVGFGDKGGTGLGKYDFVDLSEEQKPINNTNFFGKLTLDSNWHVYNLGPMDTSEDRFKNFDETAVLMFFTDTGKEFNIDNIALTQTEEHVDRIKDSWVVPASCNQTPDGNTAPQHFLGCKAYTNKQGTAGSFYQFSHVCSEQTVGCTAYDNTFNSDSAYGEVHNARCVYDTDNNLGNDESGKVTKTTVCKVGGVEYCTIAVGHGYCVFDAKQAFQNPLPFDAPTNTTPGFGIVYGPETVVTPQDQPVYAIDNGSNTCSASFKGCREIGVPTYAQDLKTVTKVDSVYRMDSPKDYGNILCENQALFCEEFSSNKDGIFYFKNPLKKICEYKTTVTVGAKTLNGWFRAGTSEPCYWTDANKDGKYDPNVDSAYLVSGESSQIWKNGDTKVINGVETEYDGWVGQCDAASDRCSNLLDVTDTSIENRGAGKSYYVINNDKLEDKNITDTERCNGKVGQKAGCALFDVTTKTELMANANASYVLSLHADALLSQTVNSLVNPVDCRQADGGKHPIASDVANQIGIPGATSVDLCARRCQYTVPPNDFLLSPLAQVSDNTVYERSCFDNSDCPILGSNLDSSPHLHGTCANIPAPDFRLPNDSNTVLKVTRDRTCSAWLACSSGRTSWDASNNKYVQICDSVNLCSAGSVQAGQSQCSAWSSRPPLVETSRAYSSRDVSWAGREYAGYAIPNQLPVERYSQVDLNANKKVCEKANVLCQTDKDCVLSNGGSCISMPEDFRLVYNAGSCGTKDAPIATGGNCKVGVCSKSKSTCSKNDECKGENGDACVIGYCYQVSQIKCTSKPGDTPASPGVPAQSIACIGAKDGGGNSTPFCDTTQGVCVAVSSKSCVSKSDCGTGLCIDAAATALGSCYNNRCLTDIRDADGDGFADKLAVANSLGQLDDKQSCRGYPETDSPFPQKVVKTWSPAATVDLKSNASVKQWAQPFEFVSGYQDSNVCSPDPVTGILSDSCMCSYKKVEYGKGVETLYFPQTQSNIPPSVCTSGLNVGKTCVSDNPDCPTGKVDANKQPLFGTCTLLTADKTVNGWLGYCLEKDTSIHLNASQDPKDQACLTWLPVDQLSGATDLYGKDVSAGYPLEDTFYCADVSAAYDVGISGEACAYPAGGCDDTPDDLNVFKDQYKKSVYCPKNYFAIMTYCGTNAPNGLCKATVTDSSNYFCVPKQSFHTKGTYINQQCLPPNNVFVKDQIPVENKGTVGDSIVGTVAVSLVSTVNPDVSTDVYLYYGSNPGIGTTATYTNMLTYYEDCKVKGVTEDHIQQFSDPDSKFSSIKATDGSAGVFVDQIDGYYNLAFPNVSQYPVCSSVVQVSSMNPFEKDKAHNNVAWTDRLWSSNSVAPPFHINTANGLFQFIRASLPSPFGTLNMKITELNKQQDASPVQIAACQNKLNTTKYSTPIEGPNGKISCPDGWSSTSADGSDARAYQDFKLDFSSKTVDLNYCECKNGDGSCGKCLLDNGVNSCNYDSAKKAPISCSFVCTGGKNDGKVCKANSDCDGGSCNLKGKICFGGPYDKGVCTADDLCLVNDYNEESGFCVQKQAQAAVILTENPSDAINRLKQIFAESFVLNTFQDVTYGDSKTTKFGSYEDLGIGGWKWNVRAQGDEVVKPTPPMIVSVGNCVGTLCAEKNPGKFSINGQDDTVLEGVGSKHANATFFAYADTNQMPLRKIVIDWGDADSSHWSGNNWPSVTTNDADSNFYKNHRGTDAKSHDPLCDPKKIGFGGSADACSSSYILYNHDYTCTQGDVNTLKASGRFCETPGSKDEFYPCVEPGEKGKGTCVFKPRVFAQDNWGWCASAGTCDVSTVDGTKGCFDKECNYQACPGGDKCPDSQPGKTDNPWIDYSGLIKIKPL